MLCPRCKVEMKQGIGINPTTRDAAKRGLGSPAGLIDHTQLTLDPVWKCPECGHSADIMTKKESLMLHYDWWGQCRTCVSWQVSDSTRSGPAICKNPESPLYNTETWTEGHCDKWDSFDIETALELLEKDK